MSDKKKTKEQLLQELKEIRKRVAEFETVETKNKVKEALRESESKYASLFENMLNGFSYHKIVVDKNDKPIDYIFLEVNEAFEHLTGFKREDIIGKKVTEVLSGIEKSEFDWIGHYGKVALTGDELRTEQYAEQLDRWYSVLGYSNKKDYFAAIFEDISERKKAEESLRKAHDELEETGSGSHCRVIKNCQIFAV